MIDEESSARADALYRRLALAEDQVEELRFRRCEVVIRRFGRQQALRAAVESCAVDPAPVRVAAVLGGAREIGDLASLDIQTQDVAHDELARADPVAAFAGGQVVEVQMAPAIPLREQHRLTGLGEHADQRKAVEELIRFVERPLVEDDRIATRAGAGVDLDERRPCAALPVVEEVEAGLIRGPRDLTAAVHHQLRDESVRCVDLHPLPGVQVDDAALGCRWLALVLQLDAPRVHERTCGARRRQILDHVLDRHEPLVGPHRDHPTSRWGVDRPHRRQVQSHPPEWHDHVVVGRQRSPREIGLAVERELCLCVVVHEPEVVLAATEASPIGTRKDAGTDVRRGDVHTQLCQGGGDRPRRGDRIDEHELLCVVAVAAVPEDVAVTGPYRRHAPIAHERRDLVGRQRRGLLISIEHRRHSIRSLTCCSTRGSGRPAA